MLANSYATDHYFVICLLTSAFLEYRELKGRGYPISGNISIGIAKKKGGGRLHTTINWLLSATNPVWIVLVVWPMNPLQ